MNRRRLLRIVLGAWCVLGAGGLTTGLPSAVAVAGLAEMHQPILAVWSAQVGPEGTSWCRHCDRFWQEYRENAAFRAALRSRYRVVYVNADRRRLEGTLLRGITALPTFVAPDRRVTGFTSSADLLARLGIPADAAPTTFHEPPATLQEEEPADAFVDSASADGAAERSEDPGGQVPDVPVVNDSGTDETGHQNASSAQVAVQTREPQPVFSLSAAITALAKPVALYLGGPLAAAAVGAAGWWWGRRRRRSSPETAAGGNSRQTEGSIGGQSSASTCILCGHYRQRLELLQRQHAEQRDQLHGRIEQLQHDMEAAEAVAGPATETRYVRVPVTDQEGEAWREAVRRVAERNPRAIPLLNTVESTASQLLHGRRVKAGSGEPTEAKPGLWSEPAGALSAVMPGPSSGSG